MDLYRARKMSGLTQIELAAKAGTERAHISRIEKHVQVLTDQMAKRLAPHLGIDFIPEN